MRFHQRRVNSPAGAPDDRAARLMGRRIERRPARISIPPSLRSGGTTYSNPTYGFRDV
jgi:hypothetical protein